MKHCPICQSSLKKNNFLTHCPKETCVFFFWDIENISPMLSKFYKGSNRWKKNIDKILEKHDVVDEENSYYVYTILLDSELKPRTQKMKGKKVYIGQTGRHPLRRLLQHTLGYKTTERSNVTQLVVGLIEISDPLPSRKEVVAEEKRYSEYRHAMGWEVYGDGLSQELQKERDKVF